MASSFSGAPDTSAAQTHPLYDLWAPTWKKLAQAYEGSGGFLDGTNLVAHPREYLDHSIQTLVDEMETHADGTVTVTGRKRKSSIPNPNPKRPSPKLTERRTLARYENVASPIIDHKLAALFRSGPTRRIAGGVGDQDHPWLQWAEADVDGAGTSLDAFMRDAWRVAGLFGHAVLVMDRNSTTDDPQTKAEQGQPILRLYTPLDMFDWVQDATGRLTGVRLYEVAPREGFEEAPQAAAQRYRIRTLTETTFKVEEETATVTRGGSVKAKARELIREGEHGFGTLPVVILYAKRRALTPVVGQSVLYDPQLYYDLYNLRSESRELLRKQTFSVLNVPLGTGPDRLALEEAQSLAGETMGTTHVLFTGLPASYISADSANVTVYQEECRQLLRTIYRLANVPFETDSKDAESEGSLALKREDMNQVLSAYADELEGTETPLAQLWFRAVYGELAWEAEWEKQQPEVLYPDTFEVQPFADMVQETQAAMALPLGRCKTFLLEQSKRMLEKFLPNLPQDTLAKIHTELDALPDPEQERKQEREANLAGLRGAFDDDEDGGSGAPATPTP